MALNPITYTEKVVHGFLRYQLGAYPFTDPRLHRQARALLSLDRTRETPLFHGPYLSLSQSFRQGASIEALIAEGVLHPYYASLHAHRHLFGHQEQAVRAILGGAHTLVSTGTGSGKTECFLYPIIDRCLRLRDQHAPPGIVAVIVYPMNALAADQRGRLRDMLAGTDIPFALYNGSTPNRSGDVHGDRLPPGASRADYRTLRDQKAASDAKSDVFPAEERASREELRTPGGQPRILLTNVKQLELLLTRQSDVELFARARLDFLVFDEAHTFTGAMGAETACLVRRLRSFCARPDVETVCIATSATLADKRKDPEAPRAFASRFFGVDGATVNVVHEDYVDDPWAVTLRTPSAPVDPPGILDDVLRAVDHEPRDARGPVVADAYASLSGTPLGDGNDWSEALYDALTTNKLVRELAAILQGPRTLAETVTLATKTVGRPVSESEVLAWLALGATARREDRALLRPVVHGFVRGIPGAVLRFPEDRDEPEFLLAAEDAPPRAEGAAPLQTFHVLVCKTCGQHYIEHHVADLAWSRSKPQGGRQSEGGSYWEQQSAALGGRRVLLTDRLVTDDEPTSMEVAEMSLCRSCGALHPDRVAHCLGCGRPGRLVAVYAIADRDTGDKKRHVPEGSLARCISCNATGGSSAGSWREPCRPVRAVTVSDVFVLAQDMLRYAERRRLLVFADNRQDAAFQSGWMRDHARRFRLRAMMAERLRAGAVSPGDLTVWLDQRLENDPDLSRSLATEVWRHVAHEAAGQEHPRERRRFLRYAVMRELATAERQRLGLEPWGRMRIEYLGLSATSPFVQQTSVRYGLPADRLAEGVAMILDHARRGMILHDAEEKTFGHYWSEGNPDVLRGYIPHFDGVPQGLKLRRSPTDDDGRIVQWIGKSGSTWVARILRGWGIPKDETTTFLESLWSWLTEDVKLLCPVTLAGEKGRPLPRCSGTYQVDGDRIRMVAGRGLWRCRSCRRGVVRALPGDRCPAYNCEGTLVQEPEDPDSYDLQLLDGAFEMLRPEEHSAQVPGDRREMLERQFKGDSTAVNTLVCTPTLEMGVDIGSLDSVLLRNVPPLPANYWQRVGRAGRRHRMAVNLTYARSASHDRAFFDAPEKLLGGAVEPPRFNLRNDLMVQKHVHATVLTRLWQRSRDTSRPASEREAITETLGAMLPSTVKDWLFDDRGEVRTALFDMTPLRALVARHREDLVVFIRGTFQRAWPERDGKVVTDGGLAECLDGMVDRLARVVDRLRRRLRWALDQLDRLHQRRQRTGSLEPDEDRLHARCDHLVKRLKGERKRRPQEGEGYDDTNTYGVLAAEGFLPGYGLETGAVEGTMYLSGVGYGKQEITLRRALGLALREYVPGNLIYANNSRFKPWTYRLDPEFPVRRFEVDRVNEAIHECGVDQKPSFEGAAALATLSVESLPAVAMCDTELPNVGDIDDTEENRFQLGVTVFGEELDRHAGGMAFGWGVRALLLRRAVALRLINVGATTEVNRGRLGYPLCLVCGQSRSPFASAAEISRFNASHTERCGRTPELSGFYADIIADAVTLRGCLDKAEAWNLLEALRIGATRVLEMDRGDLDILVLGRSGATESDAVLYDPMPGGSGLLDQLTERFGEVIRAARDFLSGCPARCERACVDCMLTYRNGFIHGHLDRHRAMALLGTLGESLVGNHEIPASMQPPTATGVHAPTHEAEDRLREMLQRAGFPEARWQHRITLHRALGATVVDAFFEVDDEDLPGVCVYLDGLSRTLHGDVEHHARDEAIRTALRAANYDVLSIPASDLNDRAAMARHFRQLARKILDRPSADRIREDADRWFAGAALAGPSQEATARWDALVAEVPHELGPWIEALRASSVEPPDGYNDDIRVGGRPVGYAQATFVWKRAHGLVGLVADGCDPPADADGKYVIHRAGRSPSDTIDDLRALLRGARLG